MANFKIIQTGAGYPDVLVSRDRDDEGEIVVVKTFADYDDTEDCIFEDEIRFPSAEYSSSFIENFNEELAQGFCERNEIQRKTKG